MTFKSAMAATVLVALGFFAIGCGGTDGQSDSDTSAKITTKSKSNPESKRAQTGVPECDDLPIAMDRRACGAANEMCAVGAKRVVSDYKKGEGVRDLSSAAVRIAKANFTPETEQAAVAGCYAAYSAEYKRQSGR